MAPVRFEAEGNLGVITIDNPPINLADNPLFAAFAEALDAVEAASIRALLVQAKGDHFGCGVNVNTTFVGLDGKTGRKMLNQGLAMVTRMEGLNIPIVCAVQGLCLAAALEIALRCDVIIASDEAKFAQVEQHIGAATFLGGAYLLAERCGPARASSTASSLAYRFMRKPGAGHSVWPTDPRLLTLRLSAWSARSWITASGARM